MKSINRDKIISDLYNDKQLNSCINKMQPSELRVELKQEMFLVICELDNDKLLDMHANGFLKYYLIRTMLNMIKSNRSNFYFKFRVAHNEITTEHNEIIDESNIEYEVDFVEQFEALKNNIQDLHWYERELFNEYLKINRNSIKLSKETKIPYRSLIKTISKVKKILKDKFNTQW